MSAVLPQTLTDLSGYGWGDLTYRSSDSDYHYYNHSWDSSPWYHGIRVKFTTGTGYNVWSDGHTGGDPSTIDDNADGYVYCYNSSNTLLIKFLKPTAATASWISSGSNTGTEGLNYTGTLTVNGLNLDYAIPSTASTGTYPILSKVLPGGLFFTEISISHTENTASTGSAVNFDSSKQWILRSPLGNLLDSAGATPSSNKKVFCNFW